MLRKRTRSHQKDQQMGHLICDAISDSNFQSDVLCQKHKANSFFSVPGLFLGFCSMASESDSVRSPTSPLDFRVFSNLGSPLRSPRSTHEGHQKCWDCSKVGLSIIDSLDDDMKQSGKLLRASYSKNILFGPQMRIKTSNFRNHIHSFEASKSLPKNYAIFTSTETKPFNLQMGNFDALFGIGETLVEPEPEPFGKICSYSLDSGRSGLHLDRLTNRFTNSSSENLYLENGTNPVRSPPRFIGGSQNLGYSSGTKLKSIPISIGSGNGLIGSLSASEIELSEDYTCVKTYGPNPKTTHIFGDHILECHNNGLTNFSKNVEKNEKLPVSVEVKCSKIPPPQPSSDFLSFCYSCMKKLDGEDIYMYRGEKAFCSWSCRSEEILIEEAMDKTANDSSRNSTELNNTWELFETSMLIAT